MSYAVRISSVLAAVAVAGAAQAADRPLSNADPTRSAPPSDTSADASAEPGAGVRFVLKGVAYDGASRPDLLDHVADPYIGREIGTFELQQIGIRAENAYYEAGLPYVLVMAPPQEVVDGVVRFEVVEGQVSRLTVLGQDPVACSVRSGPSRP